ncbi:hypothetical protein TNCV_4489801 [Trichonephila clavipes]|nr:hypothetical protein TNCV_4489801 [Trichonephila clavipes]
MNSSQTRHFELTPTPYQYPLVTESVVVVECSSWSLSRDDIGTPCGDRTKMSSFSISATPIQDQRSAPIFSTMLAKIAHEKTRCLKCSGSLGPRPRWPPPPEKGRSIAKENNKKRNENAGKFPLLLPPASASLKLQRRTFSTEGQHSYPIGQATNQPKPTIGRRFCKPRTSELNQRLGHDSSNHHERFLRSYGIFADKSRTSFRLRETQRYRYGYLSPSQVDSWDGRTFTQPQEFFQGLVLIGTQAMIRRKGEMLTAILQSTIVSIANASCTTIGPPLLKSRPSLQAQVSKTKKIRVPDRGLKAAGAA